MATEWLPRQVNYASERRRILPRDPVQRAAERARARGTPRRGRGTAPRALALGRERSRSEGSRPGGRSPPRSCGPGFGTAPGPRRTSSEPMPWFWNSGRTASTARASAGTAPSFVSMTMGLNRMCPTTGRPRCATSDSSGMNSGDGAAPRPAAAPPPGRRRARSPRGWPRSPRWSQGGWWSWWRWRSSHRDSAILAGRRGVVNGGAFCGEWVILTPAHQAVDRPDSLATR